MATNNSAANDRHPAQYLALAIGVIYTIVGIWGFVQTGFDGFVEPEGELILGLFEVNPMHNIVHLVIGLAGIALWQPLSRARIYGWLLAVGYGAVFLYGLFVANQDTQANFLALNWGDNWLHLASALAGLVIALWPADERRTDDLSGASSRADRGSAR